VSDSAHRIVVYSRANCHLCERARETVDSVAGDREDVTVETVDVDADPDLRATYGDRVPVVAVDGETAFEIRVDADDLRTRLDTA
jgi:glutaredoxin